MAVTWLLRWNSEKPVKVRNEENMTWQDIRGNKQNKEEFWERQQDLDPRPYFNTLMEKL